LFLLLGEIFLIYTNHADWDRLESPKAEINGLEMALLILWCPFQNYMYN
jgi:hypothetical protein